ncbi:hypothetical protein ABPG72_010148 [Tetrahymena utriculariae]
MNLSSQSILEAAFNNSSQFTLQSPRIDAQRYFEFTNQNEQTPSFNRDCLKDPTSPRLQFHQNFQFFPEQQSQMPSQLPINQIYLSKINLCSKNLNSQLDQGYIISVLQNLNGLQSERNYKRSGQPQQLQGNEAIQYNYQASFQNPNTEEFKDSLFSKKKYPSILQQNLEQQLDIKSQQKFQSNQTSQISIASGFGNTDQIQNNPQLVQQQRGRLTQCQQNLKQNGQKDLSQNIKSFTQQKLDSLRSSQNRKYFQKANESNEKQKQNRQQIKTPIKSHIKENNEEDKENQTKRMLSQMSQQNLNNKSLNLHQQISNVKQNIKHPFKDTNNFQITKFYEQRVSKIVNKINNKFN